MEHKNVGRGKSSTAMAFLIGAVAGGIAVLLFAPQAGAQVRGEIKRAARNMREHRGHIAHDTQAGAGNVKDTVPGTRRSAVARKGEQA